MFKAIKKLLKPDVPNSKKKREPRFRLGRVANVSFDLSSPIAKKIEVRNLSTSGIGLLIDLDRKWQQTGVVLSGQLNFSGKTVKATLQVRHVTGLTVGCEFINMTHDLETQIQSFLSAELSGLGLHRVNSELLKEPADWFLDGHGNELYFQKDVNGKVVRFHACFLSQWVEWDLTRSARFGYVVPDPETEGKPSISKPAPLVRMYEVAPAGIEYLFKRFLEGIVGIEDSVREELVRRLAA